jgi:hypothetical protein
VGIPSDSELRGLLDGDGLLRAGALAAPPRDEVLCVFAQRSDAQLEIGQWERHAEQFFRAKVGLTVEKRYGADPKERDAALVVVAPEAEPPGVRFVYARPREPEDLQAAEAADIRAGSPGMGLLARRCGYVWLVAAEGDGDRLALLLAAIVASVVLGPILSRDQAKLFGVRTARAKLAQREPDVPYRS